MQPDAISRAAAMRAFTNEPQETYSLGQIVAILDALPGDLTGSTKRAVELVVEERRRQISMWGEQSDMAPFEFMSILGEEYGELCEAVNETYFFKPQHPERGGFDAIIREAVHVAAVAVQIVEAYMNARRREEATV